MQACTGLFAGLPAKRPEQDHCVLRSTIRSLAALVANALISLLISSWRPTLVSDPPLITLGTGVLGAVGGHQFLFFLFEPAPPRHPQFRQHLLHPHLSSKRHKVGKLS